MAKPRGERVFQKVPGTSSYVTLNPFLIGQNIIYLYTTQPQSCESFWRKVRSSNDLPSLSGCYEGQLKMFNCFLYQTAVVQTTQRRFTGPTGLVTSPCFWRMKVWRQTTLGVSQNAASMSIITIYLIAPLSTQQYTQQNKHNDRLARSVLRPTLTPVVRTYQSQFVKTHGPQTSHVPGPDRASVPSPHSPPVCPRGRQSTVEPAYNIGLCNTSPITTDILWYQLIPHR